MCQGEQPSCCVDGCPAPLGDLTYGHGDDPSKGRVEGDPPKLGNIARLVQNPAELMRTGEAFKVQLICHSHNSLADDARRSNRVRKYLEELQQIGEGAAGPEDAAVDALFQGEQRITRVTISPLIPRQIET